MKKKKAGFTLIEMLVVIVIIGLLAALMAVLIARVVGHAQNKKAFGFVKSLEQACHTYKVDYHVFPPTDKPKSTALHHYLGRERTVVTAWNNDGTALAVVDKKPIMEFKNSDLKTPGADPESSPSMLIDPWGNAIEYRLGGVGVEIWSWGGDGTNDDGGEDDVGNWMRDL